MNEQPLSMNRREVLGTLGTLSTLGAVAGMASIAAIPGFANGQNTLPTSPVPGAPSPVKWPFSPESMGFDAAKGTFSLPPLPYAPESLEPHIDKATMEIHHGRHHQAYVNGLNKAIAEIAKLREPGADAAMHRHWMRELAFNAAGHANHTLFWNAMHAPKDKGGKGGGQPEGKLAEAIAQSFGSFDAFSAQFRSTAATVEGNGWAWLVINHAMGNRLMVMASERQQDLFAWGTTPILGVDVWEHAYYLKYQNKRADYVAAFMNVVNWSAVGAWHAMAAH